MAHAIEATHLTNGVGSTVALGDPSFTVSFGRVVGLLDPNGAGKTTTFRALTRRTSGYSPSNA
jgi:ABC-type multidrug transport system ATPase subunit